MNCRFNAKGVAAFSPGLAAEGGLPWVLDETKMCSTPTGLRPKRRWRNPVGVEK
jgi:hypothetical protein